MRGCLRSFTLAWIFRHRHQREEDNYCKTPNPSQDNFNNFPILLPNSSLYIPATRPYDRDSALLDSAERFANTTAVP